MSESNSCVSRQRAAIDAGLFVLRLGIGIMFIGHGWPKITGGVERWTELGGVMGMIGIEFAPAFWGFMAAFAEFAGGIALIVGLFFRPFAFLLLFTMVMATYMLFQRDSAFNVWAHPGKMVIVFLALLITGPGRVALGRMLFRGHCWA